MIISYHEPTIETKYSWRYILFLFLYTCNYVKIISQQLTMFLQDGDPNMIVVFEPH